MAAAPPKAIRQTMRTNAGLKGFLQQSGHDPSDRDPIAASRGAESTPQFFECPCSDTVCSDCFDRKCSNEAHSECARPGPGAAAQRAKLLVPDPLGNTVCACCAEHTPAGPLARRSPPPPAKKKESQGPAKKKEPQGPAAKKQKGVQGDAHALQSAPWDDDDSSDDGNNLTPRARPTNASVRVAAVATAPISSSTTRTSTLIPVPRSNFPPSTSAAAVPPPLPSASDDLFWRREIMQLVKETSQKVDSLAAQIQELTTRLSTSHGTAAQSAISHTGTGVPAEPPNKNKKKTEFHVNMIREKLWASNQSSASIFPSGTQPSATVSQLITTFVGAVRSLHLQCVDALDASSLPPQLHGYFANKLQLAGATFEEGRQRAINMARIVAHPFSPAQLDMVLRRLKEIWHGKGDEFADALDACSAVFATESGGLPFGVTFGELAVFVGLFFNVSVKAFPVADVKVRELRSCLLGKEPAQRQRCLRVVVALFVAATTRRVVLSLNHKSQEVDYRKSNLFALLVTKAFTPAVESAEWSASVEEYVSNFFEVDKPESVFVMTLAGTRADDSGEGGCDELDE
eukprot:Amastigsp_a176247_33.p1 type:complete len:572 gc:universal Amastigsp_a176247_33:88-1803(+)